MSDVAEAIERTGALTVEPQDSLRTVALSVARRLLPGAGVPELRHLALLAETETIELPRRWTDDTARTLSALLASRARRDAISEGPALIGRYFEGTHLTRPAGLSPGARSELLASAGEYLCAVGSPHAGARFGEEAQLFADTEARRYRALAVTSLGLALNGEFERAEPVMRAADDLFRDVGWDARERSFLLLIGGSVAAAARTDQDELRAISAELSALAPGDPYLDYAARTTEVFLCLIRGEYADGIAATWQLLHSSRRHSSQRMVRDALLCVRSALFLAQNLHADALATVSGALSPEGHGTCYECERASALLLLGRDRDALRETDACAASLDDHCLRPLPRLMLVRAIAYRRTGQERRARQSVASALMLIARTGNSRAPFLMLPADECTALIESAISEHPELAGLAAESSAVLDRLAAPAPLAPVTHHLPELTPTERTLAELLITPLSLAEIAHERGVSVNTVKSHVRSIYVKLGVSSRAEAVAALTAEADGS